MHNLEDQIQKGIVQYLTRLEAISQEFIFTHPANGGKRSKYTGALMKALGQRAGIPDLLLFIKGGRTVFIELKTDRGIISKNQDNCHADLTRLGFDVYIIHAADVRSGVDQVIEVLKNYKIKGAA